MVEVFRPGSVQVIKTCTKYKAFKKVASNPPFKFELGRAFYLHVLVKRGKAENLDN